MSKRLEGRRILITGAASGIGAATARLFHEEGAKLALIDLQEEALNSVAKELGALALPLNLSDLTAVEPAVERAASEMGGLDGVVNCAGTGAGGPIANVSLDVLQFSFAVNLGAPYLISRAAMPHLQAAQGGTIVNIASGMGVRPDSPNASAYAATKGGLVNLTRALAVEAAPKVRVNCICPGLVNTPMSAQLFEGYATPSDSPWVKRFPLQRAAEPSELATAILFLTSSESSFVTGAILAVDGGRTLH